MKIDPKAIGVGQYQHDMPQARLGEALDGVVEDCVNAVGVDVNTASPSLLQRVSGLTAATAKNLVKYREENGEFPKVKDTIPKSTLTLLPEHAVVRLLGIECQFLVTS